MDFSKLPRLSQTPPRGSEQPGGSSSGAEGGGIPVQPSPPSAGESGPTMFCRCGAPLEPGVNFCSNCGASYHEATGASRSGGGGAPTGFWIEAFASIAIGIFLLLMMPNGVKYWSSRITGGTFAPYLPPPGLPANQRVDFTRWEISTPQVDPATGQTFMSVRTIDIKYRDRFDEFWADTALTAFALALILEGIVLAAVKNRWVILSASALIAGATVLNLWYVIASYTRISPLTSKAYGFAPFQALAVIFGTMMVGYQVAIFREISRLRMR